jgi:hypothetical protein
MSDSEERCRPFQYNPYLAMQGHVPLLDNPQIVETMKELSITKPTLSSKDTIPPRVKEAFFKRKSVPNLMEDYHVLGFDADFLVKYNDKNLANLIATVYLEELHLNYDYPQIVTKFNTKTLDLIMNNAVWDIENGVFLKLTDNKVISHAVFGTEKLSKEQIQKIYYHDPAHFSQLNWPA